MNGSGRPTKNPQNSELFEANHAEASQTDGTTGNQVQEKHLTHRESKLQDSRTVEPLPLTNLSGKTSMANIDDFVTSIGPAQPGFSVLPLSLTGTPVPHPHISIVDEASKGEEEASISTCSIPATTKTAAYNNQNESPSGPFQVVDLTLTQHQSGQAQMIEQRTAEETSVTRIGSPEDHGRSSSSKFGTPSMETTRRGRKPAQRAAASPKTPLGPVKPSKVTKGPSILQPQASFVPSGNLAASNGRSPSEEDLYYLLLHRYRKRECTEKQLASRLRQLENENTELDLAAQECTQRLETEIAFSSEQAARIRAQQSIIDDIKNRHSKIKDFMKNVCEEQEVLNHKATLMDLQRQELRNEHDGFRLTLEDAQNITVSCSKVTNKIQTDIAELRQHAALLETSLHSKRRDLQSKESLLKQERLRNTRYEKHISDLARSHGIFDSTIRQEQQHVSSALKSIQDNLNDLKTHHAQSVQPPNIPALGQCVEMLKELVKAETASPADITDMIQVVQGLTER